MGSWESCGVLILDTATIALGDVAAFLRGQASSGAFPEFDPDKVATLSTGEDGDYPVEKLRHNGEVAAVRVELEDDVADCPGSWVPCGEIHVDSSWITIAAPAHKLRVLKSLNAARPARDVPLAESGYELGCAVRAAPGDWQVQIFDSQDFGVLGIRLVRV